MSENTTVHVKNISSATTEKEVRDFFSFCGKITSLSVTKEADGNQTAAVTFEKPTAAKTALLLDNTQLGPSLVHVTPAATLEELSSDKTGGPGVEAYHGEDIAQEDKPRSRILAEYLAHGYTVSDKAIANAIALDNQHGISARFTSALQSFDNKFQATEKTRGVDQKFGVTEKASSAWDKLNQYFEKAINTPSGQKVRGFYLAGNKQVMDVHNEARRLADLKAGKAPAETVPGTDLTKCNCGGDDGVCTCEPGKCACASCSKNAGAEATQAVKAGDTTKCACGGASGACTCEPGKCACEGCHNNPAVKS